MATLADLTNWIHVWGEVRGIVANSTPFAQVCKTHEELLELVEAHALIQARLDAHEDRKDAIGDVYVTLVMVCACNKTPVTGMEYLLHSANENPNSVKALCEHFPQLLRACALCDGIESSQTVQFEAVKMIGLLRDVCWNYRLDFTACVEHAYEIISKRKGTLRPDGVFVKETT